MKCIRMTDLDLRGKRVLIRQDLNVPIKNGQVTSFRRITATLYSINEALKQGAGVLLMSHLGRPEEGVYDAQYSLKPVAEYLSQELGQHVELVTDYLEKIPEIESGQVKLLENVRFNSGEKGNDDDLSRLYGALCDVFVLDAFGTAHRAQASTYGVALHVDMVCAGPLLVAELEALGQALENPTPPVVAIVGGSKVSTKLTVLETLSKKVDQLIPGGGIANTFIKAAGYQIGQSLYEPDLVKNAQDLIQYAKDNGKDIPIPVDVVVATEFSETASATIRLVDEVKEDEMILDVGPRTSNLYAEILQQAGTIVWNGPVGVFEYEGFSNGTRTLAKAIADSSGFSIAGGGDTLAAVEKFDIMDKVSYVSTGGGAFLEFLEGKVLPTVEILERRYNEINS